MDIYDFIKEKNFTDDFIVVECGGHHGSDTEKLASVFKNGSVYSLEANKDIYEQYLVPLAQKYKNIKVFNIGLANQTGSLPFYLDSNKEGDAGASSLLETTESYLINHVKEEKKIMIDCVTIGDFMNNNKLDKIDFLWLDIEGFEYYVLENIIKNRHNVIYIYTEVNFVKFRQNTKLYDDIFNLLTNNGFMEMAKWEQGDSWGKWQGNVLFYNPLEKYKNYLDKAIGYYFGDDVFLKFYDYVPLSRYYSFQYCINRLNNATVVELGTSRSFVDGRFEGCNSDDTKYWDVDNPEKWDWSAGCFTRTFATCLPTSKITTVDLITSHIDRCKYMNKDLDNIEYCVSSSEDFLTNFNKKIDLLYLDTGDMTPIEETAQLHLREAKIIVEKDLINENGFILIDDVRNPVPLIAGDDSKLGKAKYSIPYFLNHGFHTVFDGYQMVLAKSKI